MYTAYNINISKACEYNEKKRLFVYRQFVIVPNTDFNNLL